jgi:hypothetical protein
VQGTSFQQRKNYSETSPPEHGPALAFQFVLAGFFQTRILRRDALRTILLFEIHSHR